MDEITQRALKKALSLKYWKVETWLRYLIKVGPTYTNKHYFQNGLALADISEGNLDNYAQQTHMHNNEMQLKTAVRYEELKAHWRDTDHTREPRNKLADPNDGEAEFPIQYFIEWALSRKIKIYWLAWAIEHKLLPSWTESAHAKQLSYSVDWTMWGKIKKIELGDACGLLAGIDLPSYRFMRNYYEESIRSESGEIWEIKAKLINDNRRGIEAASDRLISKVNIESVVNNHIKSGCFIEIEYIELSPAQAEEHTLHSNIPAGAKPIHFRYVDLPAFGKWAVSAGYELPPEFPISTEKEAAQEITIREKQKALEIVEGLKALNDEYSDIDQSNIYGEIKRLILQFYGEQPMQSQLMSDLNLKGICIARPTLSKTYRRVFGM